MKEISLIMVFGALGTLSRYGVGRLSRQLLGEGFPYGTLLVNVVGCLLFGLVSQLALGDEAVPRALRLAITVGFLGAFTTFSTFGYETFQLLKDGAVAPALANGAANLILGLLAIWAGIAAGRVLIPS